MSDDLDDRSFLILRASYDAVQTSQLAVINSTRSIAESRTMIELGLTTVLASRRMLRDGETPT
jgi:hypothetical protein